MNRTFAVIYLPRLYVTVYCKKMDKWDVMGMYMFCFGVLSRFDFKMAMTNIAITTVEKVMKDSLYKWTPQTL